MTPETAGRGQVDRAGSGRQGIATSGNGRKNLDHIGTRIHPGLAFTSRSKTNHHIQSGEIELSRSERLSHPPFALVAGDGTCGRLAPNDDSQAGYTEYVWPRVAFYDPPTRDRRGTQNGAKIGLSRQPPGSRQASARRCSVTLPNDGAPWRDGR